MPSKRKKQLTPMEVRKIHLDIEADSCETMAELFTAAAKLLHQDDSISNNAMVDGLMDYASCLVCSDLPESLFWAIKRKIEEQGE